MLLRSSTVSNLMARKTIFLIINNKKEGKILEEGMGNFPFSGGYLACHVLALGKAFLIFFIKLFNCRALIVRI